MTLAPAQPGDFPRIEPLLATLNNPRITREQWRGMFDYAWPWPGAERGQMLVEGDRVVGFFGTVWSRRGERTICNLSTWVVLPEFRNHSLRLLQAVMAARDCTLTCHSPAKALYPIYKKFGFSDLETHIFALRTPPPLRALLPFGKKRLVRRPADITERLTGTSREVFEHHRAMPCGQFVVGCDQGDCHVIYTRTRGSRAWWAQVQYISNPTVFLRSLPAVRRALLLGARTPFVSIERRLLRGAALPGAKLTALGTPHVFRSATLAAEEVDALYSEVLLLGL